MQRLFLALLSSTAAGFLLACGAGAGSSPGRPIAPCEAPSPDPALNCPPPLSFARDDEAPTISITRPATGTRLSAPQRVMVAADAADNDQVAKVEFFVDAVLVATVTGAPYRFEWPASAADNGPRTLLAKAYDRAGHTAVATVAVNVEIARSAEEDAFNAYLAAHGERNLNPLDLRDSAVLAWGESDVLQALSNMYAATNNVAYLEQARRHIDAIFAAAAEQPEGGGWGWSTSRYSVDKALNGGFGAIAAANVPVAGVAVSVPEPWASLQSPDVCATGSALTADGIPAGLAYRGDTLLSALDVVLDGVSVTACLDVDFGSVEARAAAVLRYHMPDSICGDTCSGEYCGTGYEAPVFYSADRTSWRWIGGLKHTITPREGRLPTAAPWRYLRVCRSGGGNARANLAIDAVLALGARTLPEGWTLDTGTTVEQAHRSSNPADAYEPSPSDSAGLVITSQAGSTRSITQTLGSYLVRAPLKTFYDVSLMTKGTGQARVAVEGQVVATGDFSASAWKKTTLTFEAPLSPGKAVKLTLSASNGATAHVDAVKVQARVPYLVHDGMILHAIARFVQEVNAKQPALAALKSTADTYLRHLEERFAGRWDADWIERDTGAAAGVYRASIALPDASTSALYRPGSSLPHNQYLAFGRFLAVLYAITGKAQYKTRVERMARAFKDAFPPQPDPQRYVWHYGDKLLAQDPARPASVEDVSHANLDLGFVTTLHRLGLVFSTADLHRFANAFLDKVWDAKARAGRVRVDGTGELNAPGNQYFGEWITLGAVEPRVLAAVESFLGGPNVQKTSTAYPLMLANLLLERSRPSP